MKKTVIVLVLVIFLTSFVTAYQRIVWTPAGFVVGPQLQPPTLEPERIPPPVEKAKPVVEAPSRGAIRPITAPARLEKPVRIVAPTPVRPAEIPLKPTIPAARGAIGVLPSRPTITAPVRLPERVAPRIETPARIPVFEKVKVIEKPPSQISLRQLQQPTVVAPRLEKPARVGVEAPTRGAIARVTPTEPIRAPRPTLPARPSPPTQPSYAQTRAEELERAANSRIESHDLRLNLYRLTPDALQTVSQDLTGAAQQLESAASYAADVEGGGFPQRSQELYGRAQSARSIASNVLRWRDVILARNQMQNTQNEIVRRKSVAERRSNEIIPQQLTELGLNIGAAEHYDDAVRAKELAEHEYDLARQRVYAALDSMRDSCNRYGEESTECLIERRKSEDSNALLSEKSDALQQRDRALSAVQSYYLNRYDLNLERLEELRGRLEEMRRQRENLETERAQLSEELQRIPTELRQNEAEIDSLFSNNARIREEIESEYSRLLVHRPGR